MVLALVLLFHPWYWATKLLILLLLSTFVLLVTDKLRHKVVATLRDSNSMLEAMSKGEGNMQMGPAEGVLAEHYQLLNQFAQTMNEQRLISKEQHLLLQKVSLHIDVGIIAVDSEHRIVLMNPAAERLLQVSFDKWQGWPLVQLGVNEAINKSGSHLMKLKCGQDSKQVYVVTEQYLENGKPHYLLFITDVQHLLYEEERQAWQKLFRVLSHEINNSLTPISAISQGLSKQLQNTEPPPEPQQLAEGLQVINERAQGLNQFMKSYQQLTRLPPPEKQLLVLEDLVANVCGLFEQPIDCRGEAISLYADPAQLQQVLVNLVKNALESGSDKHPVQVVIEWRRQSGKLVLDVLDNGLGIQNPDNLFIPFYSTKPGGSGIGLVLCRQIARNHGGDLQLTNRDSQPGAQSRLLIPL